LATTPKDCPNDRHTHETTPTPPGGQFLNRSNCRPDYRQWLCQPPHRHEQRCFSDYVGPSPHRQRKYSLVSRSESSHAYLSTDVQAHHRHGNWIDRYR